MTSIIIMTIIIETMNSALAYYWAMIIAPPTDNGRLPALSY